MSKVVFRKIYVSVCFLAISYAGIAQSKNEYVPCQEMPNLIQNYNADYRALVRYYTPSTGNAQRGGGGGEAGIGAGLRQVLAIAEEPEHHAHRQ